MSLGNAMGGPEKAQAMSKGQGVSLILKSLSINFKRPVTYPDTVSDHTAQRSLIAFPKAELFFLA